ncbi:MAG: DUF1819 family protein [Lutibacter sp.]|nr:DUF1819 family protein [Lutibacter sp.]
MEEKRYNIDLCKGTGLIQETMILLDVFDKKISKQDFLSKVIQENFLAKKSEKRIKDIVETGFFKRYVNDNSNVPYYLAQLKNNYISLNVLQQIFLIYTSRANLILFDFIKDKYWPEINNGLVTFKNNYAKEFLNEIMKHNFILKWSESTQNKMSSYLMSALTDFKFIEKNGKIIPVFINDITANYLIHELHFSGLSDKDIIMAAEWKLFGLNKNEVINIVHRISLTGYFLFQYSDELYKINWNYKSMNEFIDGIIKQ